MVKWISHSQTKRMYSKFRTKSLHSLQSHPSGSNFLILFLKYSRLFFISIGTICQTFEVKNLIEFRPYLLLFTAFLQKIGLSSQVVFYQPRWENVTHNFIWKILFYFIYFSRQTLNFSVVNSERMIFLKQFMKWTYALFIYNS